MCGHLVDLIRSCTSKLIKRPQAKDMFAEISHRKSCRTKQMRFPRNPASEQELVDLDGRDFPCLNFCSRSTSQGLVELTKKENWHTDGD